jgi:hypothetical protein
MGKEFPTLVSMGKEFPTLIWMGKKFPTLMNIKTNLYEIRWKGMHWKCLAQDADMKQLL